MSLTAGPSDRVLWGEYNSRIAHGRPIRLYVSDDRGRSYQVAHVFEAGSIMHLHNIVYDALLDHYWVLSGDFDQEAGIGRLSADLSHFEWLYKGKQHYRAVEVFDFGDRLVYGTDTQLEPNAVVSFDKASGRIERLCETDGSCIYACRFGGLYVLTTSIEPSSVNPGRDAGLWVSRDGGHWRRVFAARKDRWHMVYFQFGSLVLPRGACDQETIAFSGQAVRGIDGRTVVAHVNGKEAGRRDVGGDLSIWDPSFALGLGNEHEDRRDWSGVIRFVAFYDRALKPDEVAKAFAAPPPGDGPVPARPAPGGDVDPDRGREIF